MNVTKPYRVRDEFVEIIKERRINMIVETREDVGEADLVNAVLWKHLSTLTTKDVLKYREEVLGKD
ncbi:hypothetical protein [Pseudomonas mangiferae]|uniref:Uncharacterized protein n=1 Tax=Pseudomonas mangiferae TaxID=2593654 RepID=A0A553H4M3_9PSED|nr:hypothetical protein [Pseudomonas mangiferae]TRX76708.1 hypothetical protein FM069_01420 [Pseudomonas mangiferae]TRX76716.1 hypothetical protein FM069_01465 [Pseudomonas mangiferae]